MSASTSLTVSNEVKSKKVNNPVQMRLRTLMAGPLSDIHVIAAFVNPFTSDAGVEPTGIVLEQRPCLKASSTKYIHIQMPVRHPCLSFASIWLSPSSPCLSFASIWLSPSSPCLSFVSAKLCFTHRVAEVSAHMPTAGD